MEIQLRQIFDQEPYIIWTKTIILAPQFGLETYQRISKDIDQNKIFEKIYLETTRTSISRYIELSIGLDSLNLRRKLSDIIFISDALNGHTDCQHSLAFIGIRFPTYFSGTSDI